MAEPDDGRQRIAPLGPFEEAAGFTRVVVGHARPAGTLVAISAHYNAEWKCEIEAEAVIGSLQ